MSGQGHDYQKSHLTMLREEFIVARLAKNQLIKEIATTRGVYRLQAEQRLKVIIDELARKKSLLEEAIAKTKRAIDSRP
ncbi:MAG: hypothetical protein WCC26_01270 [Terracidiphilus sp.]